MRDMQHSAGEVPAQAGFGTQYWAGAHWEEGKETLFSRTTASLIRAASAMFVIATPSIFLSDTSTDTAQIAMLVALVAGVFIFSEYNSRAPSLIEFRDAKPFNRIRFLGLFATVFALTLIAKGRVEPTALTDLFMRIGESLAHAMDFPYSPVRLIVLMLPESATLDTVANVRTAAGLSYLFSLLSLAVFIVAMRLHSWPSSRGDFNIWTNMPTFNPTAGGDVVERLERDGQINLILGFLLPFLIPAIVKLTSDVLNPIQLKDPHTLIWTMTAWAFIPASLIMRGIAILRVAQMISRQREHAYLSAKDSDRFPV